jgi:HAD superfamily hydrolase (TIGR01484 family)
MIIVASDFDGTLAKDGWPTEENKVAVAAFRQKGGKFGVVTGRSYTISHQLPEVVGGLDFLICSTGALILDGEGNVLHHVTAPTDEMVKDCILKAQKLGCHYFGINYLRDQYAPKMEENMVIDFGSMTEFDHCNACFESAEGAEAFMAYLADTYPGRWQGFRNKSTVDMPPYGCSKVEGIRILATRFEHPEIYTVGDNYNDIPMLTAFSSYAVATGVDAAKEAADHVCESVASMLEELL